MSNTLQTAIAFPIVLSGIAFLISAGPVLYAETAEAAAFQVASIRFSVDNRHIYDTENITCEDKTYKIACTSPERMHFLVRTVEDAGRIIMEGVTSP